MDINYKKKYPVNPPWSESFSKNWTNLPRRIPMILTAVDIINEKIFPFLSSFYQSLGRYFQVISTEIWN